MTLLLPVDPSETESLIERFGISKRSFFRVLLANAQPDTFGLAMIPRKPFVKFRGRLKAKNVEFLQNEVASQVSSSASRRVMGEDIVMIFRRRVAGEARLVHSLIGWFRAGKVSESPAG